MWENVDVRLKKKNDYFQKVLVDRSLDNNRKKQLGCIKDSLDLELSLRDFVWNSEAWRCVKEGIRLVLKQINKTVIERHRSSEFNPKIRESPRYVKMA